MKSIKLKINNKGRKETNPQTDGEAIMNKQLELINFPKTATLGAVINYGKWGFSSAFCLVNSFQLVRTEKCVTFSAFNKLKFKLRIPGGS